MRTRAVLAMLLVTAPAQADVVIGTTAFGTLINDKVSDNGSGVGNGGGTGTVAGGGPFTANADRSSAGRQVWRYTFTLAAASNLRVETTWDEQYQYHCIGDTFPCAGNLVDYTDLTFTSGIDRVRLDLTRAGGATTSFDPLATFKAEGLDYYLDGEGYYGWSYDRSASLALAAGDYTLDFTGYGAPGGPAFPGSGGGTQDVNLEAISPASVPEPATWGLMMAGFATVGGLIRQRRVSRA